MATLFDPKEWDAKVFRPGQIDSNDVPQNIHDEYVGRRDRVHGLVAGSVEAFAETRWVAMQNDIERYPF